MGGTRKDLKRTILDNVSYSENGCWLWTGVIHRSGYGRVSNRQARNKPAHRVSYKEFVGEIPSGLQLDHLCRNRNCVNPNHLQPVTSRENTLRSPIALASLNAQMTHCKHGHPFDSANTCFTSKGKRYCKICHARRNAESYRRVKGR